MLCPTPFDPAATCPTWEKCLETIFAGDKTLIRFIQRLFGLALTGDVSEQILPICWGDGANGKTTILRTIMEMIWPDYAIAAPPGLLIVKYGESHPTALADLFGKRFIADTESAEDARLDVNLVKRLTGSDRIRARRMREDFLGVSSHTHAPAMHEPQTRGERVDARDLAAAQAHSVHCEA